MKSTKLIKLLSAAMAASLLLSSCGEEPVDEPVDVPPAAVEPIFKNYFDIEHKSGVENFKEAIKFDGEVISVLKRDGVSLILLKETRIDQMNRVCESFTVYNVEKGEILSPIENTYDRVGAIPENVFSADSQAKSTVSVEFIDVSEILPLVKVKTVTVEKISEEEKKNNDKIVGDYVTVSETLVYYDIFGNEVASYGDALEAGTPVAEDFGAGIRVDIGKYSATFNPYSYELVESFNNETQTVFSGYTHVNGNYYYYVETSGALGSISVYERSGALVYSEEYCQEFKAFVLSGGNIAVQTYAPVTDEKAKGDILIDGSYFNLNGFVINVSDGTKTQLENKYVITDVLTADRMRAMGLSVTENTKNLAVVAEIVETNVSEKLKYLVVDGDFNTLFSPDTLYPLAITPYSFESAPGGHMLIELSSIADYALVDLNGKLVSFVSAKDKVLENCIIGENGVYDYSQKSLYNFIKNEKELVAIVGNSALVVNKAPAEGEYVRSYKKISVDAAGALSEVDVFSSALEFVQAYENVIVMKDNATSKYSVYNGNCEHILTTENEVSVIENNGAYVVVTEIDGALTAYKLD